jgi:hypothetical protein
MHWRMPVREEGLPLVSINVCLPSVSVESIRVAVASALERALLSGRSSQGSAGRISTAAGDCHDIVQEHAEHV